MDSGDSRSDEDLDQKLRRLAYMLHEIYTEQVVVDDDKIQEDDSGDL